jgi:hypothetical protein
VVFLHFEKYHAVFFAYVIVFYYLCTKYDKLKQNGTTKLTIIIKNKVLWKPRNTLHRYLQAQGGGERKQRGAAGGWGCS